MPNYEKYIMFHLFYNIYIFIICLNNSLEVTVFHHFEIASNSSVVAHTHNPEFWKLMQENYNFEVTLDITVRLSENIKIKKKTKTNKNHQN